MENQSFPGYDFVLKSPGRKYYNEAKEVQRFCFDKWKSGLTHEKIARMLGLKNTATVTYHIKKYNQDAKNNK